MQGFCLLSLVSEVLSVMLSSARGERDGDYINSYRNNAMFKNNLVLKTRANFSS
jgi:hypothetical protein